MKDPEDDENRIYGEKMFTNYTSEKALASRIIKNSQNSIEKKQQSN